MVWLGQLRFSLFNAYAFVTIIFKRFHLNKHLSTDNAVIARSTLGFREFLYSEGERWETGEAAEGRRGTSSFLCFTVEQKPGCFQGTGFLLRGAR